MPQKTQKPEPKVGQVWRDTYGTKGPNGVPNRRTIRLLRRSCFGFESEVMTGVDGKPPGRPRVLSLMAKTLRAGYVLVEDVRS